MNFIQAILSKKSDRAPFVITCLDLIYKMMGISVNLKDRKYGKYHFWIFTFFYVTNFITMTSSLFFDEKSFKNIVHCVLFIGAVHSLYFMCCAIHLNKRNFVKCYENMANCNDYIDDYFYHLVEKDIRRNLLSCLIFVITVYTGLGIYPIFGAVFTDAKLGTFNTMMSPAKVPWDQSTPSGYAALLALQVFGGGAGICAEIGFAFFLMCHAIIIEKSLEMMQDEIKDLNSCGENDEERLMKIFRRHRHIKM